MPRVTKAPWSGELHQEQRSAVRVIKAAPDNVRAQLTGPFAGRPA